MESLTAIDLFSGPGGLTLGFKRANVAILAAVEKRGDAVATYRKHTPEAEHFCDDIRNVDLAKYRGAADILFGGPPCQPFSTGGLRRGTADARNMIPAFLSNVEAVQPRAFLMENVPGLVTRSRIGYLREVLDAIAKMGYVPAWNIVNASHYGVPQKRKRLIIVGMKSQVYWFPKPTHGPDAELPVVPSGSVVSHTPIGQPPDCPVVYAKYPDPRRSPYAGHVYNGGGRPIDLAVPCHTILASAGGYKTHWIDTLGVAIEYNRHLMSGGQPREGQVPGARRLTVEESALLQTFPEAMTFAGSRSSQYTQVGDAVPPILAEQLASALVRQIAGEPRATATHVRPHVREAQLW